MSELAIFENWTLVKNEKKLCFSYEINFCVDLVINEIKPYSTK